MSNKESINHQDTEIQRQVDILRVGDADLQEEGKIPDSVTNEVFDKSQEEILTADQPRCPFSFVPLKMGGSGRTHVVSSSSARIINEEVSFEDLKNMTERFYEKAFKDPVLDKFIRSHDDPHGARFAKWIHQKLSGSTIWDHDRKTRNLEPVKVAGGQYHVVHDRSSAHAGAWYSPKRPANEVGRHFKLDECRVWMRLHFWAMRESGIMEKSPTFADYYVRFLGHFIRVYESSAPAFARDSLRWSADPKNTAEYLSNGRRMMDVMGLTLDQAEEQLPESEANDFVWPYNKAPLNSQ